MSAASVPRKVVEVVHSSYQPSRAELKVDMRVEATFEEAVKALTRPVTIVYTKRPKKPKKPQG